MKKVKSSFSYYKNHLSSLFLRIIVILSAVFALSVLFLIVAFVLSKGLSSLSPKLFELEYTSQNASMLPAIINTVQMIVLTLAFSLPLGIFSAIYLNEYAKKKSRVSAFIDLTVETLAGIPSIVYGLFGYLVFVAFLSINYSVLSGALTLSIMVLPTIMRTTQEALAAVPQSYREGSFALGAGRVRTIFRIVLPSASGGIVSGVILAIGRIVGETAALIYTAGTATGIAKTPFTSGRTLSVHLYLLLSEGLYIDEAYATAAVLLLAVILINSLSDFLSKKISKRFTA